MTAPRRDNYADTSSAARLALERTFAAKPSKAAVKVLAAVIHQTALYSKFEARITRSRIREIVGDIDDADLRRALKWLAEHEIIRYRPGYTSDGMRVASLIELPRAGGSNTPRAGGDRTPGRGVGLPEPGGHTRGTRGSGSPLYEDPRGSSSAPSSPPSGGGDAAAPVTSPPSWAIYDLIERLEVPDNGAWAKCGYDEDETVAAVDTIAGSYAFIPWRLPDDCGIKDALLYVGAWRNLDHHPDWPNQARNDPRVAALAGALTEHLDDAQQRQAVRALLRAVTQELVNRMLYILPPGSAPTTWDIEDLWVHGEVHWLLEQVGAEDSADDIDASYERAIGADQ